MEIKGIEVPNVSIGGKNNGSPGSHFFVSQRVWLKNSNRPATVVEIYGSDPGEYFQVLTDPFSIFRNGKFLGGITSKYLFFSEFIEGQTVLIDDFKAGEVTKIEPSVNGRFWYTVRFENGSSGDVLNKERSIKPLTRPLFGQSQPSVKSVAPVAFWEDKLDYKKGKIINCYDNISLILKNDTSIQGNFRYNNLFKKVFTMPETKWNPDGCARQFSRSDFYQLIEYIETKYGFSPRGLKLLVEVDAFQNSYHPVQDFIRFENI